VDAIRAESMRAWRQLYRRQAGNLQDIATWGRRRRQSGILRPAECISAHRADTVASQQTRQTYGNEETFAHPPKIRAALGKGQKRWQGLLTQIHSEASQGPIEAAARNARPVKRMGGFGQPSANSALASLVALLRLIDDENPAFAPHELIVAVASTQRFQ
jgi:hypothetical protein